MHQPSSNAEERPDQKLKDGLIDFTAGSVGGIALVYVGQPLDTVKVKLQTFPHLYKGPWDCLKRTFLDEGVRRGLYAGTVPALAANVAENSVLFAAYGGCQKAMAYATNTPRVEDLSAMANGAAGFFAAFFSSLSLCPTELVKVQLQAAREVAQTTKGQGAEVSRVTAFQLTRDILKTYGVRGMFRGLGSTMLREMPGYFVFFGAYEGTKSLLAPAGKTKEDCGPIATIFAGAVAGMAFWTSVFPADVVKSRIQVQNDVKGSFYTHTLRIIKNEGILGLYNGLSPTLVRTVPATATLFIAYEYTKKLLQSLTD